MSEQMRPWDTLACWVDVERPTDNKGTGRQETSDSIPRVGPSQWCTVSLTSTRCKLYSALCAGTGLWLFCCLESVRSPLDLLKWVFQVYLSDFHERREETTCLSTNTFWRQTSQVLNALSFSVLVNRHSSHPNQFVSRSQVKTTTTTITIPPPPPPSSSSSHWKAQFEFLCNLLTAPRTGSSANTSADREQPYANHVPYIGRLSRAVRRLLRCTKGRLRW